MPVTFAQCVRSPSMSPSMPGSQLPHWLGTLGINDLFLSSMVGIMEIPNLKIFDSALPISMLHDDGDSVDNPDSCFDVVVFNSLLGMTAKIPIFEFAIVLFTSARWIREGLRCCM